MSMTRDATSTLREGCTVTLEACARNIRFLSWHAHWSNRPEWSKVAVSLAPYNTMQSTHRDRLRHNRLGHLVVQTQKGGRRLLCTPSGLQLHASRKEAAAASAEFSSAAVQPSSSSQHSAEMCGKCFVTHHFSALSALGAGVGVGAGESRGPCNTTMQLASAPADHGTQSVQRRKQCMGFLFVHAHCHCHAL